MLKQDFDRYADVKSMAGPISAIWENAFFEELKIKGLFDHGQINFLDYGCGDGRYFPYLIQKGFLAKNIYGCDVSMKRIDRCKKLGWENACFISLDQHLPYPDSFFDVVNFVEVIEHIPYSKIDFYLGEIVRVMKPDAFLILTTPNYPIKRIYDIVDAFLGSRWARLRDDPTHVCRYNKKKLNTKLSPYFTKMKYSMYKEGILYKRIKNDCFMHKILAIASNT